MKPLSILLLGFLGGFVGGEVLGDMHNEKAWNYYHQRQYTEALQAFQNAVKENPKDAEAHRGLAYTYFRMARCDQSIPHAEKSEALNPSLPPLKEKIIFPGFKPEVEIIGNNESLLAWCQYFLGKYDKAITTFTKVLQEHPQWIAAKDGYGRTLVEKGKLQEAQQQFNEIKKSDPQYIGVAFGLTRIKDIELVQVYTGWGYLNYGKYKDALRTFDAILSNSSKLPKNELWRVHLGKGWALYGLGNITKARENFEKTLNLHSDTANAKKGLGFCAFKNKNYKEAVAHLQRYSQENVMDADATTSLAWSYYYLKDYDRALREFSTLSLVYPLLADPYQGMFMSYYAKQDFENAKKQFTYAVNTYPWYVDTEPFLKAVQERKEWKDIHAIIGWAFYTKVDYKNATKHFDSALQENPENFSALKGKGFIYYGLGKYKETVEVLQKVLSKKLSSDEKITTLNTFGWGYYNLKQYNDAIQAFNQSYEMNDKIIDTLRGLGWSYIQKKDYQNAISYFDKLVEAYPLVADARNGLGWAYYYKQNFTRATQEFDKALVLAPGFANAQVGLSKINTNFTIVNRAWNTYNFTNINKAMTLFKMAMKSLSSSEQWRAEVGLGWCEYSKNHIQSALTLFEKALKGNSEDPQALKGAGYAHYILKHYKEAISPLEKFASQYPLEPMAQGYLGWAHLRTGNAKEAKKVFQKIVNNYPLLPEAHGGLALALDQLNNEEKAHEHLIKAIALSSVIIDLEEYKNILQNHPEWSDVYTQAAWGYLNSLYYVQAEKYFNIALSQKQDDLEALRGLGLVNYYQGFYEDAAKYLSKALPMLKETENWWGRKSTTLSALGWSYYFTSHYHESLNTFKTLANMHAKNMYYADPHDGLGWNYLALKEYDKAEKEFTKAVGIAPYYTSARRGLASVKKGSVN